MVAADTFVIWDTPEQNPKQKGRRCTWQTGFLLGIIVMVFLFTMYILSNCHKPKVAKIMRPTWIFNDKYEPMTNESKSLTYAEQLALELVNQLALAGKVDATNLTVTRNLSTEGDIKCWRKIAMNVSMGAMLGNLIGGLSVGRTVVIRGRIMPHPNRFKVDLMLSNNTLGDIALSMTACFNKSGDVFVRNSYLNGKMGKREDELAIWHPATGPDDKPLREETLFPFEGNFYFEMVIYCGADSFHVSVNHVDVVKFKYRVDVEKITHVRVSGNVKLFDVELM
ncbi:galectin-8-like [Syngnathus scovelli]|uniref:galectin-8-like n=1 Tax=Syngnathus scovelli TaxID=161590 RepID=UPI00210FC18B|nr:galectin-8-like [Syngnathus scovelli]